MQALSSADGNLYSWVAASADYAGAGYTGPGSPLDITIASAVSGGATGSAGAAGAGLVPPVDFVLTSNDTLSGTAARDGVTLVAGTTRALATAQTTTSQNGIWLVSGGSWTRPADFNSDAQVIPGQNIFIKSGATGANTNWQLTSGSTIAGAKTYKKLAVGGNRAAVALVQTGALPAYTYDATAKTLTANANGALATTVFDGVIPLVADSVHDVLIVLEGVRNGIYTKTQDGSVSTAWIFTRRLDLFASSDFLGGVAVDVIDGASALKNNKGTRWALTTKTTITLDTTSTTWAAIGRAEFDYVKLSDAPYLVGKKAFETDEGPSLRQFAYDAKLAVASGRAPQVGILPCATDSIVIDSPVRFGNKTGIMGPGSDRCVLTNKYHCAGPAIIMGDYIVPTPYGSAVDTRSGAQAITLYDEVPYSPVAHPWFNLTADLFWIWNDSTTGSNLPETGWAAFEWLENFHVASLTYGSGQGYFVSCQGRRTEPDILDSLFSIWVTPDGGIHARLRLTDVTTGVYGAITRTGTGTSVMTGDATIKPNQDIASLKIKFLTGTTAIGVTGATYLWSMDGGVSWDSPYEAPNGLGTANSITFGLPADRFVAKFNFAAGSIGAGDVYSLSTSGVETTYALNLAAGTVAVGGTYELCLQYDSGTGVGGLYCSPTGPSTRVGNTFAGGHGVVLQKPWETTILGADMNWQCGEELNPAFDPAKVHVGAFRVSDGGITVPNATATRTSIPTNIGAGQRAHLCFGADGLTGANNRVYEADGTSVIGWVAMGSVGYASPGPLGGSRYVIPRRNHGSYPVQMVCGGFTISNKGSFGQRSGVLALQAKHSKFFDLRGDFGIGGDFFRNLGPSFFTSYKDISCTNGRKQVVTINGLLTMLGHWVLDGGTVNIVTGQSAIQQAGELFMNVSEFNRGCMWLGGSFDGDTRFTNVLIDDEECFGAVKFDEIIRASGQGQNRLTLGGKIGGNGQRMFSITWTGGSANGRLDIASIPVQFITGRSCAINFTDPNAPPVPLHPHASVLGASAFCNRPGKIWVPSRGRPPNAPNITSATTTLSLAAGQRALMPAGTTTGAQSIALPITGMNEGDTYEVAIEAQAHAVTLTSPGMTSHVVAAGLDVVRTFQLQGRQLGGALVRV